MSNLSNDVGVSSTTLKEWLSVLEASHIVFFLYPWFSNISKRLTKSPKIYFTDTGIPCSLLSLSDAERLEKDNMFGNLFENFTVLEALKARYNQNKKPDLYFLRTETGIEIDLLDMQNKEMIPYEIKSSSSIIPDFFQNIEKVKKFVSSLSLKGGVIYSGENIASCFGYSAWNFKNTEQLFSSLDCIFQYTSNFS